MIHRVLVAAFANEAGFSCDDHKYIAAGGSRHEVSVDLEPTYAMTYVPIDTFTCQRARTGALATAFIRVSKGTIFYSADGSKHPMTSMASYVELGGAAGWLGVSDMLAATFPTGSNA